MKETRFEGLVRLKDDLQVEQELRGILVGQRNAWRETYLREHARHMACSDQCEKAEAKLAEAREALGCLADVCEAMRSGDPDAYAHCDGAVSMARAALGGKGTA